MEFKCETFLMIIFDCIVSLHFLFQLPSNKEQVHDLVDRFGWTLRSFLFHSKDRLALIQTGRHLVEYQDENRIHSKDKDERTIERSKEKSTLRISKIVVAVDGL